jgi:hypothetical protein
MKETLAELQKNKEDIEILLSTLEEAYREASITEEHYNEVKGKNQKRLEELNNKIERLEESEAKKAEKEKTKPVKKETAKKPRKPKSVKERPEPAPPTTPPTKPPTIPHTTPAAPSGAAPPAAPEADTTDYSGVPQPLTDIAGEVEAEEVRPEKAPGAASGEPGTLRYTADEIKEMLAKTLREIKPQGIEVAPRVDKLEVQLEKVRAYIDSMKDERSTGKEGMQRLTEEVGEIRSNVSGLDRRLSESEIKVTGVDEALGDLRPQRFLKAMREEDASIKMHEARIDKLDEMTSLMLKKMGQIGEVLKRLGSLEKIVSFSKEAAKRLLEIENREKRISRIADKIDSIFMELNKRLDEFSLYKAKQDTLDELSQEMTKSLDELNTKIQKYAEKSDLDLFRDTIETELASIKTGSGTSPAVQKLETQKTEIEGLIAMLDEQFKAGALPEKEYQKTKQINIDRLSDIDKKISEATLGAPNPQEGAERAAPSGDAAKAVEPVPAKEAGETSKTGGAAPERVPEEPALGSGKPTGQKPGTGPPSESEPPSKAPPSQAAPAKPKPEADKDMLSQLEGSLMRGLIGRKAFEKARRLIPQGKPRDTGPSKRTKGDKKEE